MTAPQKHVNVLAYIDPGSGLMVWQVVAAAFMSVIFSLRRVRVALAKFCRKLLGKS